MFYPISMKADLQEDFVCENCGYTSPTENSVCPDCGLAMKTFAPEKTVKDDEELLSDDFSDLSNKEDDLTSPLSLEQLQSEEEEEELKNYSRDSFDDQE